ncbi:MAG: hypothetical protein WD136_02920 [Cyanobium sp.]
MSIRGVIGAGRPLRPPGAGAITVGTGELHEWGLFPEGILQ